MNGKVLGFLLVFSLLGGGGYVQGASKYNAKYPIKGNSVAAKSLVMRPSASKAQNYSKYKNITSKIKTGSRERATFDARFKKLPAETQQSLIMTIKRKHLIRVTDIPQFKLPPMISTVSDEVNPGKYGLITGKLFNSHCKVYRDTAQDTLLETHYIWEVLLFRAPGNQSLGNMKLYVKDTKSNKSSASATVQVVPPRGYRGNNGFAFANFGTANIGWSIFKNYFGANEVEFANGSRRPAAEEWYNSSYKKVGAGGDCYGMSMRSIRARRRDWRGNHSNWWANHQESRIWDYSKTSEVADSIRWDQGGQKSAQAAALINDRYNNQDHQEAYNFIKTKIATHNSGNQPMLGMWRTGGGGHAVVAYKTVTQGNTQKIYTWDNNRPYRTNVSDDENSVATVNKNNKSFTYGGYDKMIAFTFNEMNPADPHLPANATGDMGSLSAGTTIITCSKKGAIKQIRDERGRTLMLPNGKMNMNKRSKIPNSMIFYPMSGYKKKRKSSRVTELPMYIFNHSKGKKLTVDFASSKGVVIRSFAQGSVNVVNAKRGSFALSNILKPNHTMDIVDPSFMNPRLLKVIRTGRDRSEKVFNLTPKGQLPKKLLKLGMNPAGKSLMINNSGARPLNINVVSKRFAPNGILKKMPSKKLAVPARGHKLLNF